MACINKRDRDSKIDAGADKSFIRFTIGGNFYIEVLKLGSGASKYLYKGKSGNQQISDVIRYLEPNQTKLFKKSMNCEVYQSYF
jgi:hypothetical protein